MVPFWGSFWIKVVSPWVIRPGVLALSRHLVVEPVCYEGTWISLNRNPYIPPWPGVFQFSTFLSVALCKSRHMCSSGPFSSLWDFFHVIYPFSLSVMFFLLLYFTPKLFFPMHIVIGLFLCILHLLVGRIFFHYFRRSYFFVLFDPVLVYLSLPSFTNIF